MGATTMFLGSLLVLFVSVGHAMPPANYDGNVSVNPCRDACGINADCRVDSGNPYKAICSCPRGFYGHPFHECRRPTQEENIASLCSPNPCGVNAVCRPGYDNTGKDRPVCTCPPGYSGDALVNCRRGECRSDSECGTNARCELSDFGGPAVCRCPTGHRGEPKYNCFRVYNRESGNAVRSFKK